MSNPVFFLAPIGSLIALIFAWHFYSQMMKKSEGTPRMAQIASYVRTGAMAYLKQQYRVVGYFFLGLTILLSFMSFVLDVQNPWVPFAFLTGGFFSGLAGFFGMKTATQASARTAHAASRSLNDGLEVAFRSGAVMGLVVVGLGLLDISVWFIVLSYFYPPEVGDGHNLLVITTTMLTFGMGASTQALFARVGGGIYTKAADVGADLVGKVEAGIPEDDPRNPATIADNVGDNVGDVAGMGADLYESYCGSILATGALGAAAFMGNPTVQLNAVIAPMVIAGLGIIFSPSPASSWCARKEGASQKDLLNALRPRHELQLHPDRHRLVLRPAVFRRSAQRHRAFRGSSSWAWLTGVVIGKATEYYTSQGYKPDHGYCPPGPTPARPRVIIAGIGTGMMSTAIPVLSVVVGTLFAFLCASGFDMQNLNMGPLRHRHRRGGHALHPGHHPRHRRLRPDRRQRRRQRRDGATSRPEVRAAHRRPGFAGQHHRRHRQGLRHRFGGADGAGAAGLLP
ncbi:MAG: sodium/proton-translocating pyrophosphatase [Bryobacterales bacterium]|nr:sodium/proton-translocating pyrophosphatase [Bryobacterales bacterium]